MTNEELKRDFSDSEIMFLTIIGEARGEPIEGQVAVANVILNRSKVRKLSIKDVCLQEKQFSCWNTNDPNRLKLTNLASRIQEGSYVIPEYKQVQWVVEGAIENKLKDNVNGRDHYMTTVLFISAKKPSWANKPKGQVLRIGNHVFLSV